MDNAWVGSIDIAMKKAYTSRAFDIETKGLAKHSQSGAEFFGIHVSNNGKIMIFAVILRCIDGPQRAGTGDGGRVIVEGASVSTGGEARITQAGDTRFFAGWRSDPFFCDVEGAKNNLQFTGDDFFADKDVCSIIWGITWAKSGAERL
jgi:hypothetical protein